MITRFFFTILTYLFWETANLQKIFILKSVKTEFIINEKKE